MAYDVDVVVGVLGDGCADAFRGSGDAAGVLAADEDDRRIRFVGDPPYRPADVGRAVAAEREPTPLARFVADYADVFR